MSVIGKWKLVAAKSMDIKTFEMVWRSNEEIAAAGPEDMMAMMADAEFDFKEDGTISVLNKVNIPESVTEEQIEAAVAAGEVLRIDGKLMMEHQWNWKEENGDIFVSDGSTAEVFGEKLDPFKKSEVLGNTLIINENYQIVRAGETPTEVKKTVKVVKEVSAETVAAAGNYKGLYTKFVGDGDDAKNTNEPFRLELNADGTGKSFRNDLEIKVPDWSFDNGEFKLTEKFLGTIEYTGTLEGGRLSLFNGDPSAPLTCEYVFEKE